jgi:CheY-like chemotaxis protein/class 3 adenylate cyclase
MSIESGERNTHGDAPSEQYDDNNHSYNPYELDIPAEEIYFPEHTSGYYCICFVDLMHSTEITARISNSNKVRRYYAIFLNAMATIVKHFNAKVIKNAGDALIFYFPDTSNANDSMPFKDVFECCFAIISSREFINAKLHLEGLPDANYRVSADYGEVEVGKTIASGSEDLFGPTVSICSKINAKAQPNGIVIGGDLYEVVKRFSFDNYEFRQAEQLSIGTKFTYPIYSVARKDKLLLQRDLLPNLVKKKIHETKPIEESKSAPTSRQKGMPGAVMIVDDEPDVLAVFKSYLLQDGYEVEAFSDSYKALHAFARQEPHHYALIVLDIRMPSMNGLQLYQRLRAIDPHLKVIFLSALEATEELVSVLEGIMPIDVIRKPIDRRHFIQKVKARIEEK